MSHNIQFPDEIQHLLKERSQIWTEFDSAKGRAAQLDSFAGKIGGNSGATEAVSAPLSHSEHPIEEVNAVLNEINKNIASIQQAEGEVSRTQREIEQIKARARSMTMGLIFAILVIIAIIGFVVVGG